MTPFRFQLDGSPVWSGYTTGETWVTPETRNAIADWIFSQPGENLETAREVRAVGSEVTWSIPQGPARLCKLDLGLTFSEVPCSPEK